MIQWVHATGRITGLSHAIRVDPDWREKLRLKLGRAALVQVYPLTATLCGMRYTLFMPSTHTPGPDGNRLCERCLIKLEGVWPEDERTA